MHQPTPPSKDRGNIEKARTRRQEDAAPAQANRRWREASRGRRLSGLPGLTASSLTHKKDGAKKPNCQCVEVQVFGFTAEGIEGTLAGGVGTGGVGTGVVLGGTGAGGGGVGAAVSAGLTEAGAGVVAGASGAGVAGTSAAGACVGAL